MMSFRRKSLEFNSIKTSFAIITSTCLVFALASCSAENTTNAEQTTANKTVSQTDAIRIAAAANLSDVLPKIVDGYKTDNNLPAQAIEVTYASSGKLYAQMIAGAPYDIFLSANQEFPAKWVDERPAGAKAYTPFTYTQGQLAFYSVTQPVNKLNQSSLAELLAKSSNAKITIANPELAPYGASAKAYLQDHKLYDVLNDQKRLIQAENIGQAFQYANTGSVDYGFVAQSQVIAIKATPEQFYTLSSASYPAILQDGIVISDAVVATDFADYLRSAKGQRYLTDAGYLAVK